MQIVVALDYVAAEIFGAAYSEDVEEFQMITSAK